MKKYIKFGLVIALAASFSSCDHLLDKNRYPDDSIVSSPQYWSSEVNVQGQINRMYSLFTGYGNGAARQGGYFNSFNDDQVGQWGSSAIDFPKWSDIVPSTAGTWSSCYSNIRSVNIIIDGVRNSSLADVYKENFEGLARMFRAMQFYSLVSTYGDVTLVTTVIDPSDEAMLYSKRDPRNEVMDQALEDIDYAIAHIIQQSNKMEFSVDMALAIKTGMCLYEASYARYHQKDEARAKKFYEEVVKAANALEGRYSICEDYASLYNSALNAEEGIENIRNNPEIIFFKAYKLPTLGNSVSKYTSSGVPIVGMTKDAFDSYLFNDGKPKALTSCDTSDKGFMNEDGDLDISKLLEVRDKRLTAQIDPVINFDQYFYSRPNSDDFFSTSGYSVRKFTNVNMPKYNNTTDGQGYLCAPIYWLARIYLNVAEAKAELGTMTNADVDKYLNPLYRRAGLPNQTLSSLSSMNDPDNNMGVSSLIWEVRRCRRAELMFDGDRYADLSRWHQLDLLTTSTHPNIMLGAYVGHVQDDMPYNNITNGYVDHFKGYSRTFQNKYYLSPLGYEDLNLNPNLTQTPGWPASADK